MIEKTSINGFAENEEEAKNRFKIFGSCDPFPDIPPALLNSADIIDYVAATGMIFPFYRDSIKSASYEVGLKGKIIYWDEKGNKQSVTLEKDKEFRLPKNSIAYVTPEATFRIPEYIALRFNLKITHVQRGILLGTGPLVDPGFEGNLFVPLHNLTYNDYVFTGGEGFIWVEFTKLSPNGKRWQKDASVPSVTRFGDYKIFPCNKKNLQPESYLAKALKDQEASTIRSSIPEVVREAKEGADKALLEAGETKKTTTEQVKSIDKKVDETIQRYRKYSIFATIALIITLLSLFVSMFLLVMDATSYVKDSKEKYKNALKAQSDRIDGLKKEIDILREMVGSANLNKAEKVIKPMSSRVAEPRPRTKRQ